MARLRNSEQMLDAIRRKLPSPKLVLLVEWTAHAAHPTTKHKERWPAERRRIVRACRIKSLVKRMSSVCCQVCSSESLDVAEAISQPWSSFVKLSWRSTIAHCLHYAVAFLIGSFSALWIFCCIFSVRPIHCIVQCSIKGKGQKGFGNWEAHIL